MSDIEFAARLRHCHGAVFGLDKPDWIAAPDHERVRWLLVAERYRTALFPVGSRYGRPVCSMIGESGRMLYESWDIDGYAVPWAHLPWEKRSRWMQTAREATAWGMAKAA